MPHFETHHCIIFLFLLLPSMASCDNTCTDTTEPNTTNQSHNTQTLKFKLISIASILTSGALGVSLPLLSTKLPFLNPQNDIFFIVKAFAAGVILATGFVHILPDAFQTLTSPCLEHHGPWLDFPFAGLIAMAASVVTLMMDSLATGYYKKQHMKKSSNTKQVSAENGDEEVGGGSGDHEHVGHVHMHTHATHGHAHGPADDVDELTTTPAEVIRHRIISQVIIRTNLTSRIFEYNTHFLLLVTKS